MPARRDLPLVSADILARIRARRPRVHCITNAVAQNFTANMLLAAGAVPSMTIASDEIADFVARAVALLVNLGTLDPERRGAIEIAIATAGERVPWILDPVFVDRSAPRAGFASALVARRPRAIRLNGAEFSALAGGPPSPHALTRYAAGNATVVGLTGATAIVANAVQTCAIVAGGAVAWWVVGPGAARGAAVEVIEASGDSAGNPADGRRGWRGWRD